MKKIPYLLVLCCFTTSVLAQNNIDAMSAFALAKNWVPYGNAGFGIGLYPTDAKLVCNAAGISYVEYLGQDGRPHVMTLQNGIWVSMTSQPIIAAPEPVTSLTLNHQQGIPYVAISGSPKDVEYLESQVMKLDNGQWVNVGDPILYASFSGQDQLPLVISNQGTPFLAATDEFSHEVSVMKFNGSQWVQIGNNITQEIPNVTGLALATDANGTPYIAYDNGSYPTDTIRVMKFDGATWNQVGNNLLVSKVSSYASQAVQFSFALDSQQIPYIAYQDNPTDNNGAYISVVKLNLKNNAWIPVGNIDFAKESLEPPLLVISSSDIPLVEFPSYQDRTVAGSIIVMGLNKKNKWVPKGNANSFGKSYGGFPSFLTLDPYDNAYVIYNDSSLNDMLTVKKLEN